MVATPLLAAGALAFGVVLAAGPATIKVLRHLKFGQAVREDGPQEHLKKAGTPTMGGVLLLLGWLAAALAFGRGERFVLLLTVAVLGFALIGLADDFLIVVRKRSLGLRAREKLLAQAVLGVLVAAAVAATPDLGTNVRLPGVPVTLKLPLWGYVAFGALIMVGTSNAVNLADGLDGLAAGTVALAGVAYTALSLARGQVGVAIFTTSMVGACLGFIWFNAPPAQVFMGDTGSLALGGALGALALLTKTELLLPIIGGIFVAEALSVIIQVLSFRLTGRRVLLMAPLHHHFELAGMPETKVVARFWLVGLLLALAGLVLAK